MKSKIVGTKQRYSAMKRYFKFANKSNKKLCKPCKVVLCDNEYYCFLDGHGFTLTKESIDNIEEYDNYNDDYYNVKSLLQMNLNLTYYEKEVDIKDILTEAKSKGYKYKKAEIRDDKFSYVLKLNNAYFKIGILDQTYSIIHHEDEVKLIYSDDPLEPICIETSIGKCMILPIRKNSIPESTIIIEREV